MSRQTSRRTFLRHAASMAAAGAIAPGWGKVYRQHAGLAAPGLDTTA